MQITLAGLFPAYSALLLPGALLMAMRAELLAPFMFINLRFATFF
jgi:hypothetical protein